MHLTPGCVDTATIGMQTWRWRQEDEKFQAGPSKVGETAFLLCRSLPGPLMREARSSRWELAGADERERPFPFPRSVTRRGRWPQGRGDRTGRRGRVPPPPEPTAATGLGPRTCRPKPSRLQPHGPPGSGAAGP
jgi:hypothetical protein